MGGLRKKIPITYWTMLIATLAIAGIPGFAGFFSKDEILEAARIRPARESRRFGCSAWPARRSLRSTCSGSIFLTFFGEPRYDEHKVHVHESPKNMTVPLMILAFLSIFGGWFAAPQLVGGTDYFAKFLAPVFTTYAPASAESAAAVSESAASPAVALLHALTGWPVIVGVLGLLAGLVVLHQEPGDAQALAAEPAPLSTRCSSTNITSTKSTPR